MSSSTSSTSRIYNFSAGPAALPLSVLEQVQRELLALPGCGASILEISHRSQAFGEILTSAESRLRSLLKVPDNYRVLFLQGGSRLQFSMVPMNLLRGQAEPAEYLVTGSWGAKARDEARKEGEVRIVWDGKSTNYDRLPTAEPYELSSDAAYLHITSNETIQGVQWPANPPGGTTGSTVVADCSSDFLCRSLPVDQYGLIYACAQKNAGPAGLTVILVRDDLLARSDDALPGYLNYREHADNHSLYNTPCTFGIYIFDLILDWIDREMGGLDALQERNRGRAAMLYQVIDESSGFYEGHARRQDRSVMNVTFRMASAELDQQFVEQAEARGMGSLKGHRSVGGIRASIYNAMPDEGVIALRDFMHQFQKEHAGS